MTDSHDTVEQLVRAKLSQALGGRRGIVEGAVPTVMFTISWIVSHELHTSLMIGLGAAIVLLVVRIVQRSNVQFVLNAFIGIGIAAFVASRTGHARDVFLPGILLNAGTATVLILSIVVGWPLIGFMIGSVTDEDPIAWHADHGLVRLCTQLTWILALSSVLRVAVQYPLWATDHVALLGTAKVALGWPLYVATFAVMAWLLGRDRTPVDPESA